MDPLHVPDDDCGAAGEDVDSQQPKRCPGHVLGVLQGSVIIITINNLTVIQSNLKKKKVEETVASLAELNSLVQSDEKEIKQMLGKDIRYMEYYRDEQEAVASSENESVATGYSDDDSDDDDYWKPKMDEMFKLFYEMMKNIESLPGNNFKKGAELEIQKMKEIAEQMERDRDDEICLKFEPYIKKALKK